MIQLEMDIKSNNKIKKNISRVFTFDFTIFLVLLILFLLNKIVIFSDLNDNFRTREIIYIFLYFRILTFYRIHIKKNLLYILLYIIYCIFICVYTYFLFDLNTSIVALNRFLGVALLAPLSSIIIKNYKQLNIIISLWVATIFVISLSMLYEYFGGNLSEIIFYEIEPRFGVNRLSSLIGSATVSAMYSPFVIIFALFYIKNIFLKIILLILSIIPIILGVSKAAFVMLIIILLSLFFYKKKYFAINRKINISIFVFLILFLLISSGLNNKLNFKEYLLAGYKSMASKEKGGVMDQIIYRSIIKFERSYKIALNNDTFYIFSFFIGNSFGISEPLLIKNEKNATIIDSNSIKPHNSFLEIYLVGGIFLFFIFIMINILTFQKLNSKFPEKYSFSLLYSLIICILYMLLVPIIYEHTLGSFFWVLVGIAANSKLYINPIPYRLNNSISEKNLNDRGKKLSEDRSTGNKKILP